MYTFLIVGHGQYPSGVQSALKLLVGDGVPVDAINLQEDMKHEDMQYHVKSYLETHDKVVVFADLTGGAPHQKASTLLLEESMPSSHMIISNVSMSIIIDIIMKLSFSTPEDDHAALNQVKSSINEKANEPTLLSKLMMD